MTTWIVFFIVFAYLLGSVSSAILICKLFNKPDPRSTGSQNPGATNVLRVAGKAPAIAVLIFDVLKGAIPTYAAFLMGLPDWSLGLVAIAACLGHMLPIFFSFQGGKAVATALGAMLTVGWNIAIALIVTWVVTFKLTRYSSMAAMVTVSLAPVYTYFYKPQFSLSVAMISGLILFRHRSNLKRLLNGEEQAFKKRNKSQ